MNTVKENYKNELLKGNEWLNENDEYGLILTDDLDSLLSCAILKSVKGWNVEQAMMFKGNMRRVMNGTDSCLYDYHGVTENATHEAIGVDLALTTGKCFDNHLTAFDYSTASNPESINVNRICGYNRWNYYKKYNLSTVLLLWSLFDLPKDDLPDELMMLLISIDGSYDGFYTNERFVGIHEFFIRDVLDLPQFLECERRHTRQEFKEIQKKYKSNEKISFQKDGHLATGMDIDAINELLAWYVDARLELPTAKFYKKAIYKDIAMELRGCPSEIGEISDNVFCYALTKKNYLNYSQRIA